MPRDWSGTRSPRSHGWLWFGPWLHRCRLLQDGVETGELLVGEHAIDVQQDFYFTLHLGHAEKVLAGGVVAEVGRVFDFAGGQVENLRDGIDDDAHEERAGFAL